MRPAWDWFYLPATETEKFSLNGNGRGGGESESTALSPICQIKVCLEVVFLQLYEDISVAERRTHRKFSLRAQLVNLGKSKSDVKSLNEIRIR